MLAGVVLAVLAAPMNSPLGAALSYLALLQFVAGILNLLPIPGFDGFGVIEPYLSARLKERIRPLRPWIPLAVFAILFSVPTASAWLFDAGYQLFDWAGGSNVLAGAGARLFRFWA